MKLFDDFEAVWFPEEELILVTRRGYLYYIYDPGRRFWRKHRNAGNDHITVKNYQGVLKEEIMKAMGGRVPSKETDFIRLCKPEMLPMGNLLDLLKEDYPKYMSDYDIYWTVYAFLSESDICHVSYEKVRGLLDKSLSLCQSKEQIISQIENISFDIIGRDIFKNEIGIVDGHDGSSYFWIMPVRIIDYSEDTCGFDNVAEMRSSEISIEEEDVAQYLTPFLYKYFDEDLEANKNRIDVSGFEWYLEHNFFTFETMEKIIEDMKNTADALKAGRSNEYTDQLRKKRGRATDVLIYAKDMTDEQISEYNANRPTEDDTEAELIIDFYRRFIYRMEYMMKVGAEKGYNLISFMGP